MALHDPSLRALYDLKVIGAQFLSVSFLNSDRYLFNAIQTLCSHDGSCGMSRNVDEALKGF